MFIPLPLLIVLGLVVAGLLVSVLRLSRRRDPLMGGQALRPAMRPPAPPRPVAIDTTLSPEIEAELRALIGAGRKIEAIKIAREATGLGLRDSKELVERLE